MPVNTDSIRAAVLSLFPDNFTGAINARHLRSGIRLVADVIDSIAQGEPGLPPHLPHKLETMSRAEASAELLAGTVLPPDGRVLLIDGAFYEVKASSTDIDTMPGLVPAVEIWPHHFGWVPGADVGISVTKALAYGWSKPFSHLRFPAGRYIFETAATISLSGGTESEMQISGAGRATVLCSANSTGTILITATGGNRRSLQVNDMTIVPVIQAAGCAFKFTCTEGGINNRVGVLAERLFLARFTAGQAITTYEANIAKHTWGQVTGGSVLDFSGVNRPVLRNIVMHPQPDSAQWMGVPYALLNLDGCYNITLENSLLNGRAQLGVTNKRTRSNEGGRIFGCNIVGPEEGIYVDSILDGTVYRHPRFSIINTHVNAVRRGIYVANTKFLQMVDVWVYGMAVDDEPEDGTEDIPTPTLPDVFVDIHLHNVNAATLNGVLFRASKVTARRHLYFTGGTKDVVAKVEKGFVAQSTLPPVYIDETCENILIHAPYDPAHYDFRSYPDQLFEVHPSATGINVVDERGLRTFNGQTLFYDRRSQAAVPTSATILSRREARVSIADGTEKAFARQDSSAINATFGRMSFEILVNDALTLGFQLDRTTNMSESVATLLIRDATGAYNTYRVKVGANGTGPGGVGRMLYIDNGPT